MDFDRLAFHETAVRTPSHEDVEAMRELLVETLGEADRPAVIDEAGNTIATISGSGDGPHLCLNTHLDTVPPHIDCVVDGDIVRGRGACDAKGSLAAMVDAFLRVEPPVGRVTLAVTPDEERRSSGAAALDPTVVAPEATSPDAFVVGEPTDLDVCTAARGRFQGTITVRGDAAHAAEPETGVNAVRAAAGVLEAMDTYDEHRGPAVHDHLGRPTLTATQIEGGAAANQVPATCTITFDRRSVPPETAQGFRDGLAAHLDAHVAAGVELDVALVDRETPFLEAWSTDADAPIVAAIQAASGGTIRPFGAATEASYFATRAPTVVFGPGVLADDDGAVAHAPREYVRRSDIDRAAVVLREAIESFLT